MESFQAAPLPKRLIAGQPAALSFTAVDHGEIDVSYNGSCELSLIQETPAPSLVLSLVAQWDYIEIINSTDHPVEFHGGLHVYSNPATELDKPQTILRFDGSPDNYDPITFAPGERVMIGNHIAPNGYLGRFIKLDREKKSSANWAITPFGAVALVEGTRTLDAWIRRGAESVIRGFPLLEGGLICWEGPGVIVDEVNVGWAWRSSSVRRRSSADWQVLKYDAPRPANLTVPLLSAPLVFPVSPSVIAFAQGVWNGTFTAATGVKNARLRLDDLQGHLLESDLITINPRPKIEVLLPGDFIELREGGAPVQTTLRLETPATTDITIQLNSDPAGEISIPPEVVIAAGASEARFDLVSLPDARLEGPVRVTLTASAVGFENGTIALTNLDRQAPNQMTLHLPERIALNPQNPSSPPFTAELTIDPAPDGDVWVSFITEVLTPGLSDWQPAPKDIPNLSGAWLYAGRTNLLLPGVWGGHPLVSPVRYRIRTVIPGWPEASNELTAYAATSSVPTLNGAVNVSPTPEALGMVTNAYVVWTSLLSTNPVAIRLKSSDPLLVSVPELVVLTPFESTIKIPAVFQDDSRMLGDVAVTLTVTADGFLPATLSGITIVDNDPNGLIVGEGLGAGEIRSGPQPSLRLAAMVNIAGPGPFKTFLSSFSGRAILSFDRNGQSATWNGPGEVFFTNGSTRLTGTFTEGARAVRFRARLDSGTILEGAPFDLAYVRQQPPPPVDLVVSPLVGAMVGEAHELISVPVLVSNASPVRADRVVLYSYPFGSQTVIKTNLIGNLAGGATFQTNIDVQFTRAGIWKMTFGTRQDNFDSNYYNNTPTVRLTAVNKPIPGRVEVMRTLEDLAYSSQSGFFYASPNDEGSPRIQEIDPTTGNTRREMPLPGPPGLLQVSDDGLQLWILLNGGTNVARMDLATGITNLWMNLTSPATDIAAIPLLPDRIVLIHADGTAKTYDQGNVIASLAAGWSAVETDLTGRGVIARSTTDTFSRSTNGVSWVSLGTATMPYGQPFEKGPNFGFRSILGQAVTADGGGTLDSVSGNLLYGVPNGLDITASARADTLFYLSYDGSVLLTVIGTNAPQWRQVEILSEVWGRPRRLVTWGTNGLAWYTQVGNQLIFLQPRCLAGGQQTDVGVSISTDIPIASNHPGQFQITVTNRGPGVATNVVLATTFNNAATASGTGAPLITTGPGRQEFLVGRLAPSDSTTITLSVDPAGSAAYGAVVSATVTGGWSELNALDNTASVLADQIPGLDVPLSIGAVDTIYDPTRDRFLISILGSPPKILVMNPTNAFLESFQPVSQALDHLRLTDDGVFVYGISDGGTRVRRIRIDDGSTDLNFAVKGSTPINDILPIPGDPDRLAATWTPSAGSSNRLFSTFNQGVQIVQGTIKGSDFLVAGETNLDVFGVTSDARENVAHFRVRTNLISRLADVGMTDSNITQIISVGGWFVDNRGAVRSRATGAMLRQLWTDGAPRVIATVPDHPWILVARAPHPLVLNTLLELIDVESGAVIGEREVVTPLKVPISKMSVSRHGTALITFILGQIVCPIPMPSASATLRTEWTAGRNSFSTEEAIDTTLILENLGSIPVSNLRLELNISPMNLLQVSTANGKAVVSTNEAGYLVLNIGDLDPSGRAEVYPRLIAHRDVMMPLDLRVSTTMPHVRNHSRLPFMLEVHSAPDLSHLTSIHTGINGGVRAIVVDPIHEQLWAQLESQGSQLSAIDPGNRRILASIPIDFTASKLEISEDAKFLYAAPDFGAVRRIDIEHQRVDQMLQTDGVAPLSYRVGELKSVSGRSDLVMMLFQENMRWTVGMFLSGRVQPRKYVLPINAGGELLGVGNDQFIVANDTNLVWVSLVSDGVKFVKSALGAAFPGRMVFNNDRLFFSSGKALNPASGAVDFYFPSSDVITSSGVASTLLTAGPTFGIQPPVVRGLDASNGQMIWSITTGEFTGPVNRLAAIGTRMFAGAVGSSAPFQDPGAYGRILLGSVPDISGAMSLISLTGRWKSEAVPRGTPATLSLGITNLTPWVISNVTLRLPDDFDAHFSGWRVSPSHLAPVRNAGRLVFPIQRPFSGLTLDLFYTGQSAPGDFQPTFAVESSTPPLALPGPAVSPVVRVTTAPKLILPSVRVREADVNMNIPLTFLLSEPAPVPVRFTVTSSQGTALGKSDFVPFTLTGLIPANSSETTLFFTLIGDIVPEPTESFSFRVSALTGAQLSQDTGVITIDDNDVPAIRVSTVQVPEGNSNRTTLSYPIQLSFPPLEPVRIDYATLGLTATSGQDFIPMHGTLLFAAGQTQAVVQIQIIGETVPELDETLRLMISTPGGVRSDGSAGVITLQNDDELPALLLGLVEMLDGVRIPLLSIEGVTYQLERSSKIDGPWETAGNQILGSGHSVWLRDPTPPQSGAFYRARQLP